MYQNEFQKSQAAKILACYGVNTDELIKSKQEDALQKAENWEDEDIMKSASDESKNKVKKVMDEWKEGKLNSGSGDKVTEYKQALAIALNEAGLSKSKDADTKKENKEDDETEGYQKLENEGVVSDNDADNKK